MKALKITTKTLATSIIAWIVYGLISALFIVDLENIDTFSGYFSDFNTLSAALSVGLLAFAVFGMILFVIGFVAILAIYYIWKEWWK